MVLGVNVPCPKGDGGQLNVPDNLGGFLAALLTGQVFVAGAKALAELASGGATGGWHWLECNVCHEPFVGCEKCGYVWHAAQTPKLGDTVECPSCHNTLI